jgi:hypothetical protein
LTHALEQGAKLETLMARNRTIYRNILTRSVATIALLGIYSFSFIGASAVLLGASTTSALARGGHGGSGGHGGHGGGWRGAGFGAGIGLGLGLYGPYGYGGYYPYGGYYDGESGYYDDEGGCYLVRRRVLTPHGWRIRRVQICE